MPAVPQEPHHLVLYGTQGCHLCEDAEALLLPWVSRGWQVECIDIAEDDALLARFATAIPVLEHPLSGSVIQWPFDADKLSDFLAAVT